MMSLNARVDRSGIAERPCSVVFLRHFGYQRVPFISSDPWDILEYKEH